MLTITTIRALANHKSYTRGYEIQKSNKIMEFNVEEDGAFEEVTARVKGSGRNVYDVSVTVDLENERVEESYCDCPAFYSYDGICKHCVAVLLEYLNYKKRQKRQEEETDAKQRSLAKLGVMKGMSQQTTPAIRNLLQQRMMTHVLPVMQEETYGKVKLSPYLLCDGDHIRLEFKIGSAQMYVLKDVFTFADLVNRKAEHYYGQKLQFVHMIEAFSEESRALVKFIQAWVERNKDRYAQNSFYGSNYNYRNLPKLRVMPLDISSLEEFLLAVGGYEFYANVNGTGEHLWHVVEEPLNRALRIQGEKNGIELTGDAVSGYRGVENYIYFHENKIYLVNRKETEPVEDFLACLESVPGRSIYIQKEDVPTFCHELLPVLEKYFQCEKIGFDENAYGVIPVTFEIYLDAPQKDFITCEVMAVYGENKYSIYEDQKSGGWRDLAREIETGRMVASYCNAYDEEHGKMVLADDEEMLYEFLVYGIPKMQELGEVYISDALKRMKVTSAPKVKVGISLAGDMLELSVTAGDVSREQLIEMLSKYNRKKKFYRLKSGEFVNVEDDGIAALMELRQSLQLKDSELRKESLQIPRYRALYLDSELREFQSLPVVKDKNFKALVRNMKTVEDNDFDIPESLENTLREYQKRGYLWIKTLKNNGFGGILADDMGLGKTLQVITFLLSEQLEGKENTRTLIVSPSSLVYNWKSEIERFAPRLSAGMVVGTQAERREMILNSSKKDILITSYDLLKRDRDVYSEVTFAVEVIDEAQYIKNHNTQAAKAVKEIEAGFKLALTGTPVENRLSELWSIFDYLMPGFLFGYQRFREEIEIPIVQNQDEQAMKRLQKMIHPFILRRLKKDVLTDLPDKLEKNMYAVLEGEQQKLYDAHVKRMQMILDKQSEEEFKTSKIQILSELTKLRQICCNPGLLFEGYEENSAKTDMCIDLIENAISGGHKILLFSQFTSMLEKLEQCLEERNISYYTLTGATGKEKRARLVEQFNQDDTSVFCISLKAGGTGLNLTAADIVIHYDPWWNIAVQNQATDRAHRIGQENVVSVYKLIMKGTVEENIVRLQEKKRELADQVLEGQGVLEGSFTREELIELLK